MSGTRPLAVFDIDGVLADVRHRLHYVAQAPKNWAAFFAASSRDPALDIGVAFAHQLAAANDIVYVTGRPESERRSTQMWLRAHELPSGRLVMRRADDRRAASVIKVEALRVLSAERAIAGFVDDDAQVIAAARAAGYATVLADWMDRSSTAPPPPPEADADTVAGTGTASRSADDADTSGNQPGRRTADDVLREVQEDCGRT